MKKETAIRVDGMLFGIRANLDFVAFFLKSNISADEYREEVRFIGQAMASLVDMSNSLYMKFPDIVPKEFKRRE